MNPAGAFAKLHRLTRSVAARDHKSYGSQCDGRTAASRTRPATGPSGGVSMLDGASEIRVAPALISAHSATVTDIAHEIDTAARTAQAIRVDPGAYGVFCRDLPAVMQPVMKVIGDGIAGAAGNLAELSAKLQAVAGNYVEADQANASRVGGLP